LSNDSPALDDDSAQLLAASRDAVLLGVIRPLAASIHLFTAASATDVGSRRFAGHMELIRAGVIAGDDIAGFSIEIKTGAIRRFYRSSILNEDYEDFAIPRDMMLQVLDALNLPRAADFRWYP